MRTNARALAVAALLIAALAAAEDATPAEAKIGAAVLSGGDLRHPIALPFEDSFLLLLPPSVTTNMDTLPGWPARLDTPPATKGIGYALSSGLEGELAATHDSPNALWSDITFNEERQPATTYYPAVSAIEIRIGDDPPRWARLDDDRARLLDRYIELGRTGALPDQPSILDVLAAEARVGTLTPLSVDGRPIPLSALEVFWRTAGSSAWPEVPVYASLIGAKPQTDTPADYAEAVETMVYGYPTPVWLSFDIDGREVRLAYYPVTGTIAGLPLPNGNAWIGRGFVIPPELRESFHSSLGLPPIPAPAEALAHSAPGDGRADPARDGRFEGRVGSAAALALLVLAGVAAVGTASALIRGARRESA